MNIYEKLSEIQDSNGRTYFLCKCKGCGAEMKIRADYFKKHKGLCATCLSKGNKYAFKHGDYRSRLYKIWIGLSHRRYKCYNPTICEEWKTYKNFKEWALANGYAENLTIDRINNRGDYNPENCQWITLKENAGKDKFIFTDSQCKGLLEKRRQLGITQREMAKREGVSRNTIQRAEKRAR